MTELTDFVKKEMRPIDKAANYSTVLCAGFAALDAIMFFGLVFLLAVAGVGMLLMLFLRWWI